MDATTTGAGLFPLSVSERQSRLRKDTFVQTRTDVQCPSDELLLACLRRKDREALSLLFHRYATRLYQVGRRILRDSSEAEDLVQEVFLYIYGKSELFDPAKGNARSWIFQVAYTQAFLRRRQLKTQGFYASLDADHLRDVHGQTSVGQEYEGTVEGFFGRNNWRKILDSLTQEQLETLRLHFFEGYTFSEIADKLGQSYANVRNHYYRGLEKLRKHIAKGKLNVL